MSQGGLEILCWIEKRLFFCQKSKLNFCPWLFYRQREGSGLLFKCLFNCCVYDDDDAGFGVTENYLHCGEWKNLLRQHYQILNRTSPIIQNQSIYQNIDGSTHVWPDFQEYLVWSQASHCWLSGYEDRVQLLWTLSGPPWCLKSPDIPLCDVWFHYSAAGFVDFMKLLNFEELCVRALWAFFSKAIRNLT